ncbi:MAG: thioredoxin fold domain-containing protein, partial [Thermotogaceae bacterium]|nr:thioredoxin fold domain-containing protein [Thermotogaceae bacterium]
MRKILAFVAAVIFSSHLLAFAVVHDFDVAQELARIEQKKIVLIFEMKTCGYCKLLNSTTLQDEKVQKFLSINYITATVYADENIELFQKFNVRATPTLWFFQYEKEKLVAITYVPGYLPADLFLKVIKYIYKLPEEKFDEYSKKEDNFIGERK